jgi:hypothetical protein
MRKLVVIGIALIMILVGFLAFSTPAAAEGKPYKFELHNKYTVIYDCDGYTLVHEYTLDRYVKFFFNKDGYVKGFWAHWNEHGTWTCVETGMTLEDNSDLIRIVDYEKRTISVIGVPQRITVKGEGIVVHGSGIVVMTLPGGDPDLIIHEGGQHPILWGLWEPCDLLPYLT